jgi:hypothetical protein
LALDDAIFFGLLLAPNFLMTAETCFAVGTSLLFAPKRFGIKLFRLFASSDRADCSTLQVECDLKCEQGVSTLLI